MKNNRRSAFADKSAWLLIIPAAIVLALLDRSLLLTLLTWTCYAIVMAGLTIIISRIVFPHVDLAEMVRMARDGSLPAAIIAAAIVLCFGVIFFAMVTWAKT